MQQLITLTRKQETRKKIQLGGLIVKAGLAEESATVLLGMLLEACDTLQNDSTSTTREHWQALGNIAFSKE